MYFYEYALITDCMYFVQTLLPIFLFEDSKAYKNTYLVPVAKLFA